VENIRPFTLRELTVMARSRQQAEWERTAEILSLFYNMNRDPKSTRYMSADEFNPYTLREDADREYTLAEIRELHEGAF
jgi:hypothetical protein